MNKIFVTRQLPNEELVKKLEKFFIVDIWKGKNPPSKENFKSTSSRLLGFIDYAYRNNRLRYNI
ncbi:MAG: hypothetical protein ACJ0J6_03805 [Dehalococcoidia bacterium]